MIHRRNRRFHPPVFAASALIAVFFTATGLSHAAALQGRQIFGPLRIAPGDSLEVVLSNVWTAESSAIAVRIVDSAGNVVKSVGYGKDAPLPQELKPNENFTLGATCPRSDPAIPCTYTAIAELFNEPRISHIPLLSAQVISGRDGTVAVWGTNGVALNAIWGTNGTALDAVWGTNGVARTGVWGTNGVARKATVGAFPAVRVAAGETYQLVAQNPYAEPITIRASALQAGGNLAGEKLDAVLYPGEAVMLPVAGDGVDIVGLVEVVGSGPSPLLTMQVVRSDGRVGIWGTNGTAYEADARR